MLIGFVVTKTGFGLTRFTGHIKNCVFLGISQNQELRFSRHITKIVEEFSSRFGKIEHRYASFTSLISFNPG
jgi:hypothetical protein